MAMRINNPARNACFLLALCMVPGNGMSAPAATGDQVAIVVRSDVPVDNLSFNDIKKLLLGDRQF